MKFEPAFYSATGDDIDQAATLAADAVQDVASLSGRDRARLLWAIAENLLAEATAIVERANLETGLLRERHIRPRLAGGRTSEQRTR
jgi:NADP-dependent aldehyde dehydrogenase